MKFRPQRGGLEESMKEVVEIDSLQELIAHLITLGLAKEGDIVDVNNMKHWDQRCGWDTYSVVVNNTCAVGYTDGPPRS